MNGRAETYARNVAEAVAMGPYLAGHDWDGATYVTDRCVIDMDFGRAVKGPGGFIQYRHCTRCGHRLTVVGLLRSGAQVERAS